MAPQGGKMESEEQENLGPYRGSYRSEVYKEDVEENDDATLEDDNTDVDDETISIVMKEKTEVKTEEHDYKKRYDDLKRHYDSKLHEWKEEREHLMSQSSSYDEADIDSFKENYPDVYNVVEAITAKNSSREVSELREEINRLAKREEQLKAKSAYQELLALHPDFAEIKKSPEFIDWLDKQPPSISDGITKNSNDVQYADLYKADTAGAKKRGRPSKRELEAAAEAVTKTRPVSVATDANANKRVWTTSEIRKLKPHEFDKFEKEIDQARAEGRIIKS
jgi:hypothetical protein